MKKILGLFIVLVSTLSQSCGVYSLSGASIPNTMKTVAVRFFENNASFVVPYLSQQFTQGLEDRIRNQSHLNVVRVNEDASFSGRITDYSIKPTAIEGSNNQSSSNRLTITVQVKYQNNINPELSFDKSFTRYKDFSIASQTAQAQEAELIRDINVQLTEAIFNEAFASW